MYNAHHMSRPPLPAGWDQNKGGSVIAFCISFLDNSLHKIFGDSSPGFSITLKTLETLTKIAESSGT